MELRRTIREVAELVSGEVAADAAAARRRLAALRPPADAGPDDLAILFGRGARAAATGAGCVVATAEVARARGAAPAILVADPEGALDAIAGAWGPRDDGPCGRDPGAVVGEGAELAPDVALGAGCVVGPRARVGEGSVLWPGVVLGPDVVVGRRARLGARVVVEARCRLGDRVVVGAGSVIGADGFGFRQLGGRHVKSPQVGGVRIGDDVELGALCTVDRARLGETVVGEGCKLDDHVHVGHNASVGPHCVLAGGTRLAGSVTLGRGCLLAGGIGVADGVHLGEGTTVAAHALVVRDTEPGAVVGGMPARALGAWKREVSSLRRLPDALARMRSSGRGA